MKVIDKTPLQDTTGSRGIVQRVQTVMEYGFTWQGDVEAQQPVITQLERVLEKGYTLIRNLSLENSKIIEPMILIGPPGVFVLYVTRQPGFFEARGDEWTSVKKDRRTAVAVNPMTRVSRLSRALQVYLNRQGLMLPCLVDPVLIAGSPAVHIDVLRPIVRIVQSDGVKQWAAGLSQARPILRAEVVLDVVDRLLSPRPQPAPSSPAVSPSTSPDAASPAPIADESASRARLIFRAAQDAKPFDPAALDFEFDEKASNEPLPEPAEKGPSETTPAVRRRGLSGRQLLALVAMILVEFAVLAAFLYMILFGSR